MTPYNNDNIPKTLIGSHKMTHCIGTYNSLPYLKLTIQSVRKNEYYLNQPFIVFADGCTDGTNEWLIDNEDKYNLTLIIEPRCEDSSNGYGMNRCAELVETDYINFIHADMYMAKNFDYYLLNAIKTSYKHIVSPYRVQPNIFNQGKEKDRPGTLFVDKHRYGNTPDTFNDELFDLDMIHFVRDNHSISVPKAEGCSFIISKKDWETVGGNDLRFKPNGFDDTDLFIRMKELGFTFQTIASSVCYHFAGRGGNGYFGNGNLTERNQSNYLGERQSAQQFINKYGTLPSYDENLMPYIKKS